MTIRIIFRVGIACMHPYCPISIPDNVVQQLEKYLGRVKEITGALKISHSYPIVSLDFFSSLETIRGESAVSETT